MPDIVARVPGIVGRRAGCRAEHRDARGSGFQRQPVHPGVASTWWNPFDVLHPVPGIVHWILNIVDSTRWTMPGIVTTARRWSGAAGTGPSHRRRMLPRPLPVGTGGAVHGTVFGHDGSALPALPR
ncbi:hypothetical protein GCM10010232_66300 [Streptomyces amakusaensis]